MQNTSGQGKNAIVPPEIDRWNWGAFLLNWIWGLGNNTLIALLVFVPLLGFFMIFVVGAKGSAWAWQNKKWDSVEQFQSVQRQWTKWALILWLAVIVAMAAMFFALAAAFKSSDAYKLSAATVNASQAVAERIGNPVSTGFPMGSIETSGPRGSANLSFSVSGPTGKGEVYVQATKAMGQWHIDQMVLEVGDAGQRIDLLQAPQ